MFFSVISYLMTVMQENSVAEQIKTSVGSRIRTLRELRGLSLRVLSELCGLSVNAISRIERGENSPTVSSLHLLASALDIPITTFFTEEDELTAIFIKRDHRLRFTDGGVIMESLGSSLIDQHLEPFLLTIDNRTWNEKNPIIHPGEEFIYCLEGEIEVCVRDRLYRLSRGDSLLFKATHPHWYHNLVQTPSKILLVFEATQEPNLARQRHLEMYMPSSFEAHVKVD
jgi:transcriptional regulator with XRE-family HTH domain